MSHQYRYGLCSAEALPFVSADKSVPNPMGERHRLIPLNNLKVGDSLYFHYGEIHQGKIMQAKECAMRYNKQYDNMFKIIKHLSPIKMLEIARIK